MSGTLASAVLRLGRWLQSHSFGFTPEQIGVNEGLRAATAVSLMVVSASLTGDTLFAWGAFAAFWTCLADPSGPVRRRLYTMGGFILTGTVVGPLMSCSAGLGPWAVTPLLFLVVGLCNMARLFGPEAGQAGMLASVVAVVSVEQPAHLSQAPALAVMFLIGGALAVFICAAIWPIHPFQPARRALKAVFRELGHMAAALEAGGHEHTSNRSAARTAIERARAQVDKTAAARHQGPVQRELLAVIEAADEIFAGLIALEHACVARRMSVPAALLAPLRQALALAGQQALHRQAAWGRVHPYTEALAQQAAIAEGLVSRVAALWAHALGRIAVADAQALAGPRTRTGTAHAKPSRSAMRAALRHGLRVAMVVLAAYIVTKALAVPYAYWATMAVVVVMQPLAETTWPRMLERVAGSVAGGFSAAALTLVLTTPLEQVLFVFPLAALTIALRTVNYTLFTFFLTPLFVLVADMVTPGHGWGLAFDRAGCNVLGSVLGALGCLFLWREHQARPFSALLADAEAANHAYAAIVLPPEATLEAVEAARRAAGIASVAAEEALQRQMLEGRPRGQALSAAAEQLAALRRLAGAAAVAWLESGSTLRP